MTRLRNMFQIGSVHKESECNFSHSRRCSHEGAQASPLKVSDGCGRRDRRRAGRGRAHARLGGWGDFFHPGPGTLWIGSGRFARCRHGSPQILPRARGGRSAGASGLGPRPRRGPDSKHKVPGGQGRRDRRRAGRGAIPNVGRRTDSAVGALPGLALRARMPARVGRVAGSLGARGAKTWRPRRGRGSLKK